jgi:hypothetical protein
MASMTAAEMMDTIRYEAPAPAETHSLTTTAGGFQMVNLDDSTAFDEGHLGATSANTGCIDGDWTFFVRPGTANKVVVDFEVVSLPSVLLLPALLPSFLTFLPSFLPSLGWRSLLGYTFLPAW